MSKLANSERTLKISPSMTPPSSSGRKALAVERMKKKNWCRVVGAASARVYLTDEGGERFPVDRDAHFQGGAAKEGPLRRMLRHVRNKTKIAIRETSFGRAVEGVVSIGSARRL
jgi:hypothetical protein